MSESFKRYGTSTTTYISCFPDETAQAMRDDNKLIQFWWKIVYAVRAMTSRKYWTRVNAVEAWGFGTKLVIIVPGLLFEKQWWWLYIFAVASSAALIWTSTRKTLPTIILFNVAWILLASTAIIKHFV